MMERSTNAEEEEAHRGDTALLGNNPQQQVIDDASTDPVVASVDASTNSEQPPPPSPPPPSLLTSPTPTPGDNAPPPPLPPRPSAATNRKQKTPEQEKALAEHKLPQTLPTLGQIKRSLPPHVFKSSLGTSMYYVGKDLAQILVLFRAMEWVWSGGMVPDLLVYLLMPGYWLLQGTLFWALFVVGHDAGHSSFSTSPVLNDVVGNALHSFLLCPYYCWKLTHRLHHAFTGNMDKDEVFYPLRYKDNNRGAFLPVFGFGTSWFAYLFMGYHPRSVNHFNPSHPLFKRDFLACSLSISLVVLWACFLFHLCVTDRAVKMLVLYGVPEFVFASYLVLTTFLHHTDEDVPWYDDSTWDYVRGQLSSVDRHYGWCHELVHNIGTHQIHHLFSTIPHYHLEEATKEFRCHFPHLVRLREERLLPAFVRMFFKWISQRVVPDSTLVHVYT